MLRAAGRDLCRLREDRFAGREARKDECQDKNSLHAYAYGWKWRGEPSPGIWNGFASFSRLFCNGSVTEVWSTQIGTAGAGGATDRDLVGAVAVRVE